MALPTPAGEAELYAVIGFSQEYTGVTFPTQIASTHSAPDTQLPPAPASPVPFVPLLRGCDKSTALLVCAVKGRDLR